MAEVAQDVRDEVADLLAVETKTGPIRSLYRDVREHLLGDITQERFADVYAQTMVYGMLTARIAHPEQFESEQSLAVMKFDNEFLDAIYARFREGSDGIIDVDELGLADLAQQLTGTNVDELLADFGADNQRDDPVVYFYEEFLAQYDPEQRKDLGAFYTPKPVVRYIVRTVDDALKSFGRPLGVADPTTWGEYVKTHPDIGIPKGALAEDSVVSMFDANGTGTFRRVARAGEAQRRRVGRQDRPQSSLRIGDLPRVLRCQSSERCSTCPRTSENRSASRLPRRHSLREARRPHQSSLRPHRR